MVLAALLALALLLAGSCRPPAPQGDAQRPSPQAIAAWQSRKFGMFIHWGLYSIPAGVWKGERVTDIYSEQILLRAPIPLADYKPLASQFNPTAWDPKAIARLAKEAGMRFIVITSKHHDGFSLFRTRQSRFNVMDATPYGRDVIQELADATRAEGLSFGVYFSSIDWHWGSVPDKRNNNPIPKELEDLNVAQLQELTSNYGPLSEIWFDMGDPTPQQSKRWADTVHAAQPDCMVSGRVFNHQGDFTVMGDNAIPTHILDEPWQTPGSIFHETWGYRSWQQREDLPGKVREHLLNLVKVVSRGGNYLLNIGPRGDGSVVEYEAAVLRSMGRWLALNGEAIYDSQPQPFQQVGFGYVTRKPGKLYLLVTDWPRDGRLVLPSMRNPIRKAYFLSDSWKNALDVASEADGQVLLAQAPALPEPVTVLVAEYDGELSLAAPLPPASPDEALPLMRSDAREFFHYNGRSYYEKPKLYKLEWRFQVPADGDYVVEAMLGGAKQPRNIELDINGKASRHEIPAGFSGDGLATWALATHRLRQGQDYTLTLTPPRPFAKGTPLGVEAGDLRMVRVTPGQGEVLSPQR
jgi:alpha-L-fucosidase